MYITRPIAMLMLWSTCSVMLSSSLRGQRKVSGYRWRLLLTSEILRQFILPFILHCLCNEMFTLSTVTLTISSSKAAASGHNPILRTFSIRWCCKIHCNIDSRSFYKRRKVISRQDVNYIGYIKKNACSPHQKKHQNIFISSSSSFNY